RALHGREPRRRAGRAEPGALSRLRGALARHRAASLGGRPRRARPRRARGHGRCGRRLRPGAAREPHHRRGDEAILTRRIIPCLDVRDGVVVKGVRFRDHRVVGDIMDLARRYRDEGADELVFYDITASPHGRTVDRSWVNRVAAVLDIPFCVAGGIRTLEDAESVLNLGADQLSIHSPALANPELIDRLVRRFGSQCVVIGIDSLEIDGEYQVYQYTGDPERSRSSRRRTLDWVREVQERGAGEIVLNCMNQDGVRRGYDLTQLARVRDV